MSLCNLLEDVRSHDSYHAFIPVALLPIPKVFCESPKLLGVLYSRLFHKCLDHLWAPVKRIANSESGTIMVDPSGINRRVYTLLGAYMVDLPEALMIAGVQGKTSPTSTASYKELGNRNPMPRRFGSDTVRTLARISLQAHPWTNMLCFGKLCNLF
jgi:hypothetical protein